MAVVHRLFFGRRDIEYLFARRSFCIRHCGAHSAHRIGDHLVLDRDRNLARQLEAGWRSSVGAGNYFVDVGGGGVADVDPGGVDCDLIVELNSKLSLSSHCAGPSKSGFVSLVMTALSRPPVMVKVM